MVAGFDDRLDELLEDVEEEMPFVRPRRFGWRWLLIGLGGALGAGVVVAAILVVWPWLRDRRAGDESPPALASVSGAKGAHDVSDDRPRKKAAGGKLRWDSLFDLGGHTAPTGPEVIGGEAGVHTEDVVAVDAPESDTVLTLEKSLGKCGFESQEPNVDTQGVRIVHGTLSEYGSLYSLFTKNGFSPNSIVEIIGSLETVCDPKTVRAEDGFVLYLDESSGALRFFELKRSDTKIFHVLAFESGSLSAHKVTVPTERRWVKSGGVVEGSLFGSVMDSGLDGTIVNHFMGVFGAYAKFSTDTREGDTFRVIASGEWLGKEFLGYDPPQVLEYNGQKTGNLVAIYYESEPGKGKFYWPDGTSLKRLVAEVPLDTLRVTSSFDPNRMHPVLKVKKPHLGTDFGASIGTPVMAFDGGQVVSFGMKGASGNMIQLDHGGGIQTYYLHLNGFAKGLKKGQSVKKGDVIGYVGNTGRSTGPHLHFGLKKSGAYVDPMKYLKVTTIKEQLIGSELRDGFQKRAKTLLYMLKAIKVPELPVKKAAKKDS